MVSGLSTGALQPNGPHRFAAHMWGYLVVVLIAALPLFGHLDELPILLYDEQRLATNALEMNDSGNLIVTTYDGAPDYSNTKPPLMIWLQAASMQLFGDNELAVRLPSALAALATCLLLYAFCARRLRSPLTGICAVAVLCTTHGYPDIHGTRTGDYDALLTFFTTAYCLLWFVFLEERRNRTLYFFFGALLLAVLTKCTAACLMLPALAVFTICRGAIGPLLRNKHFYFGLLLLILPVATWYAVRQHLDGGYLNAVWKMDLFGRYNEALSFPRSPGYYIGMLFGGSFSPWMPLALAGVAAAVHSGNGATRRLSLYLILTVGVFIAVLSFSVTKFYWYLLPAYPLLAILSAMGLRTIISALSTTIGRSRRTISIVTAASTILIFLFPYRAALDRTLGVELSESMRENAMMGFFMKDVLHGRRSLGNCSVAIESYEGNIRWYFKVLARQGRPVTTVEDRRFQAGQKVAAFQQDMKEFITSHCKTRLLEDFRGVHVYEILEVDKP